MERAGGAVTCRRVALVLATMATHMLGTGCAQDKPTFQVTVARKPDRDAVKSVAVLAFDWTLPGTRPRVERPEKSLPPPQPAGDNSRAAEAEDEAATDVPPDTAPDVPESQPSASPSADEDRDAREDVDEDDDTQAEEDGEDEDSDDEETDEDDSDHDDEDMEEEADNEDYDDDIDDDLPAYIVNAGETVADHVAAALMDAHRYSVRERNKLSAILEEHDLAAATIVADRQYALAGGLLGVDGLVVGEVHHFSRRSGLASKVSLSCRCIDTRTGNVIWSMSGEMEAMWTDKNVLYWSRELVRLMVDELERKLDGRPPPASSAAETTPG